MALREAFLEPVADLGNSLLEFREPGSERFHGRLGHFGPHGRYFVLEEGLEKSLQARRHQHQPFYRFFDVS